jgi:hypothetical protein
MSEEIDELDWREDGESLDELASTEIENGDDAEE